MKKRKYRDEMYCLTAKNEIYCLTAVSCLSPTPMATGLILGKGLAILTSFINHFITNEHEGDKNLDYGTYISFGLGRH